MIVTSGMAAVAVRTLAPLMVTAYKGASKTLQASFTNWSNTNNHEEIARSLLKIGIIKTIWSAGKEKFIKDFYYPSKITSIDTDGGIDHIDQLPNGNLVIQGIVGQGKSMFMRHLACSAISASGTAYIPVFIELQKINPKMSLKEALWENLELLGVSVTEKSFKHLASNGYLVLLLDGFDEIIDTCINETVSALEELQRHYPKLKIIVSSRPGSGIQQVVGFEVLELTPLTTNDYEPFLKRLQLDVIKRDELLNAISSSTDAIKEIISTPLMLTLVVWVYESEQEIPANLKEFFEKLFHVVFTRHDSLKVGFTRKHYSGLSETKLLRLFESFCFMVVQEGFKRSLTRSEFNSAFNNAIEYTSESKCDVDDFRNDIVKVACLMLDDGLDLTTFLHKSILDYYAAAFILQNEEEIAEIFYLEAYDNFKQWQHVLSFLRDADQYRYSKYYLLNHFPEKIETLTELLSARNTKDLTKFIVEKFGNANLMVNHSGILVGWRGQKEVFSEIDTAVHTSAIIASSNTIRKAKLENKLSDIFTDTTASENKLHHTFTLVSLINTFGPDEFWIELQSRELSLTSKLDQAQKTIEKQIKRKKIFGKKVITAPGQ